MTDKERIQHLENALRPFIDGLGITEAAKMIDKRYLGLNPVQVFVTKFQFQAAKNALRPSPQEGAVPHD